MRLYTRPYTDLETALRSYYAHCEFTQQTATFKASNNNAVRGPYRGNGNEVDIVFKNFAFAFTHERKKSRFLVFST